MKEKSDQVLATAHAFLKRFGLDCGKKLEGTLPEIGLELHVRAVRSYEGALLRIRGVPRGYIVLNQGIREEGRRRFTLAHEIAHYLLPSQQDLVQPCTKACVESWDAALASTEIEANRFAAEILMPRLVVLPCLKQSPTFTHVRQIAEACSTSLTASAYRLSELTSFRMATVWSQDGRVRWYKESGEFVRWIRKGQLSCDTFAYDSFRGREIPDSLETVPATAWLFEKGLRADARILEHSVPLPAYGAVLTILVIPDQIEDDEDSQGSELDPNEFTLNRTKWPGRR